MVAGGGVVDTSGGGDGSCRRYTATSESLRLAPTPLLVGEVLFPHQDSADRRASAVTSLWSLIATIIGGGVLALPFGFARTGVAMGTITLIFAALMNDFSLDILVAAARRTGSSTYEELALRSFGPTARMFTIFIFAPMLWLLMVSYCIICADLMSPIITVFLPPDVISTSMLRVATKIGVVVLVAPLCYAQNLNALRPTSIMSVVSVIFLTVSLVCRVAPVLNKAHSAVTWTDHGTMAVWIDPHRFRLRWWPQSASDYIYVFPTFMMALLCQYNVLPTHSELSFPTRQRMRLVNHITISFCTTLYFLIGLFGYLYSRDAVCANVFLNFDPRDVTITIARCGLTLAVMASVPLAALPCRQAICRLIELTCKRRAVGADVDESDEVASDDMAVPLRQADALKQHQIARSALVEARDAAKKFTVDTGEAPSSITSPDGAEDPGLPPRAPVEVNIPHEDGDSVLIVNESFSMGHVQDEGEGTATRADGKRAIVATCLMSSVLGAGLLLDNIMVVWSIAGASCSLALSFLLPALFFLKVRRDQPYSWRKGLAYFCVIGTLLLGTFATYMAVLHAGDATCPHVSTMSEKLPMMRP